MTQFLIIAISLVMLFAAGIQLDFGDDVEMPEWVELYNPLDAPVNLSDMMIKDATENPFILTENTVQLPPDSFAVIAANESFTAFYPGFQGILLVPESFPNFNNSGDSVVILDAAYGRMDRFSYTPDWHGKTNVAFEKNNPLADPNNPENWGRSRADDGATPGERNSILLSNYDLKIDSVRCRQNNLAEGDSLRLLVYLSNHGLNPLAN